MSGRSIGSVSSSSDSSLSSTAPILAATADADRELITAGPSITVDLVTAGRRHLAFLLSIAASPLLSHPPSVRRSIRRYEELWMPLIADLSGELLILPPPDVHWIWHCHCLNPAVYREYCASRFGTIVDRPAIYDEENELYAAERCREIWEGRYPSEPFDLVIDPETDGADGGGGGGGGDKDLLAAVERHRNLWSFFSDPYFSETVYLVAARRRYLNFLHLVRKLENDGARFVPASDILLIWLTHQSFPVSYAKDLEGVVDLEGRAVGFGEEKGESEEKETRQAWEEAFDEPYEKAGAWFDPASSPARVFFSWEAAEGDVNSRYKGLQPRFLMEVCVFLKGKWETKAKDSGKTFLRLRTLRCCRELKIDKQVSNLSSKSWRKTWHLYCEFSTKGILIEVRQRGNSCVRNSKLVRKVGFLWNDLLRSTSLALITELEMQVRTLSSATPPVQAPYLLKCVPDRTTDDSGAMISDEILRMNRYHPQEGRWLTRTVLDHAGRECFVVRIRVGRGIWRRGAETPSAVKWEDRIIEVREGPWSYVASSIGSAPEKVIGTATPKREDSQGKKVIWCLSTGDVLRIQWNNGLNVHLESKNSAEEARLHLGRKLQCQRAKLIHSTNTTEEEEEHYVTLVRKSLEHPEGKATALINWKLLAVEFLPEEDAVLVLLLCMAIVRTISEIRREDVAGLLVRRRVREVKAGQRDWGSVVLPFSELSSSSSLSPNLQPWYWNAKDVLTSPEAMDGREHTLKYSPADGNDELYKQSVTP